MQDTQIQWATHTFNPWIGCRRVAPECLNCYAETLDRNRFSKTLDGGSKEHPVSHWGSGPRHRTSPSNWKEPLKWNRLASNSECGDCDPCLAGQRCALGGIYPRVFCASLSDWLDDENVPIEWLADLLALIHETPNLDWLLLTKRPGNWERRIVAARDWMDQLSPVDRNGVLLPERGPFASTALCLEQWQCDGIAPANVWIGVSAGADQQAALDIPAKIHFLSCEPMLHAVDLSLWLGDNPVTEVHREGLRDNRPASFQNRSWPTSKKWVILGGESGSKARPCYVDWIRDAVRQCKTAGVPVFVKQLGSRPVWNRDESKRYIRDSHGGEMDEWPEDLRVREFPTP